MAGVFQSNVFQRKVFQQERETSTDFYGGVGHYLYEQALAQKLVKITRKAPPPIDRRTAPQFKPLARPYSAPAAPAPNVAAPQNQRMAPQAAAVDEAKKRRDMEAIRLLTS